MEKYSRAYRAAGALSFCYEAKSREEAKTLLDYKKMPYENQGNLPSMGIPQWKNLLVYKWNHMPWTRTGKLAGENDILPTLHRIPIYFSRFVRCGIKTVILFSYHYFVCNLTISCVHPVKFGLITAKRISLGSGDL